MRGMMRRLLPISLTGQMVILLLAALALSQAIAFVVFSDERTTVLKGAAKEEFLVRSASTARLLEATPPALHAEILRAVGTSYTRYWVATDTTEDTSQWMREAWIQLAEGLTLKPRPGHPPPADAAAQSSWIATAAAATNAASWRVLPAHVWSFTRPAKFLYLEEANAMGLTVPLGDGRWLNAFFAKRLPSVWSSQSYLSLGLTALALSLIAVVIAGRIAQPLRQLAQAAEGLGRGEQVEPVPERGPTDVRRTAEAFNQMQTRLRRFVEDRTRMLAAIGHDLRTPLTSLRLRAEFVSDEETREKLLATVEEMQTMTEATLAFAREDASGEATRAVDFPALLESLCADLADLGWNVNVSETGPMPYRCRPDALRRALRNLIENAVRYGGEARVALSQTADGLEITIDDDGPGIPDQDLERVFQPFVRLENSRNRETGGVGLGLSIARSIVRAHGGDVILANRPDGLRATIRLPRVG
ncbi:ATP-binding protein [Reyranella sp. CPCC 100927]|uniref:ATP-binding protein n=1 Tax=Reyranella sp. CPCC 100927 TaxID=2599616 RepID=UPI002102224D|nr:ATP-binding protein [Reyranella sp. CPCC 100927]